MGKRRARATMPVDPFYAKFRGRFERVAASGSTLLYVVGALLFAGVGAIFLIHAAGRRAETAWEAVEKIQYELDDARLKAAPRRSFVRRDPHPLILQSFAIRFEKTVDIYGATSAAPVALYRAARLFYEAGVSRAWDATKRRAALQRAVAAAQRLIEVAPAHVTAPLAYELWGKALEERGEAAQAVDVFLQAQAAYPESFLVPKLDYHVARNYWSLGKRKLAETHIQKALSRTENLAGAWTWRARAAFLKALLDAKPVEGLPPLPGKTEKKDGAKSGETPGAKTGAAAAKPAATPKKKNLPEEPAKSAPPKPTPKKPAPPPTPPAHD